jgi:predicted ATPase
MAHLTGSDQSIELVGLEIKGLLSLRDVKLDLDKPATVLIGPNGSGKSNLLKAVKLLGEAADGALQRAIRRGGGAQSLLWEGKAEAIHLWVSARRRRLEGGGGRGGARTKLRFEVELRPLGSTADMVVNRESLVDPEEFEAGREKAPYKFVERDAQRWMILREGQLVPAQEVLFEPLNEAELLLSQVREPAGFPVATTFRQGLSQIRAYSPFDLTVNAPARRIPLAEAETVLASDGENLVSVLANLLSDRTFEENVYDYLRASYPRDFEKFIAKVPAAGRLELLWRHPDGRRDASATSLSDGTLRFLALCCTLVPRQLTGVTLLEEPETGLHPALIRQLAAMLSDLPESRRVIVSTHSAELVSALDLDRVAVVVLDRDESGTQARRLNPSELEGWLREYSLGELWKSGQIGGVP